MTTPRDTPASRRTRANGDGDGTVYQRKDGRWEAASYVLAPGNTRKHVRVYGSMRKEDAIDLLGLTLRNPSEATSEPDDGDDPLCAAPVR